MMLGYGEWNVNGRSPDPHGDVGRDDALPVLVEDGGPSASGIKVL
jgi:hypothetical protein